MPTLFDPIRIGHIELKNRIIMAPMTRSRANEEGVQPQLRCPQICEFRTRVFSRLAEAGI